MKRALRRWLIPIAVSVATIAGLRHLSHRNQRLQRAIGVSRLFWRSGVRQVKHAPLIFTASGEHRENLRHAVALQTAEDIADTLGNMKGVLMKLGQMASYVDPTMSSQLRSTLTRLQHSAPPMSIELAGGVIKQEFGVKPEELFAQWDPMPIAAASIGQVHRAIAQDGRPLAVKLQYPGIAETMRDDLENGALLGRLIGTGFPGLDTQGLLDELKERLTEELDYRQEANNQRFFANAYRGHPFIHIPEIIDELSGSHVLTMELVDGMRFEEFKQQSQAERDLAAEAIFRFVFRSLYDLHAFNGDPHPGNYFFHGGGKVTFLDFGLVKRFSDQDLQPLIDGVQALVINHDPERFRAAMVEAKILQANAPVSTEQVVDHIGTFYETLMENRPMTLTPEYATNLLRKFFDRSSPLSPYSNVPRPYVLLQRINLGLYAVLSQLNATASWRGIAEEIWPFMQAPPSTPLGELEANWRQHCS